MRETSNLSWEKVIEFDFVKCEWIIEHSRFGFRFEKNGEEIVLVTKQFRAFIEWKAKIREVTVISDFYEEFEI